MSPSRRASPSTVDPSGWSTDGQDGRLVRDPTVSRRLSTRCGRRGLPDGCGEAQAVPPHRSSRSASFAKDASTYAHGNASTTCRWMAIAEGASIADPRIRILENQGHVHRRRGRVHEMRAMRRPMSDQRHHALVSSRDRLPLHARRDSPLAPWETEHRAAGFQERLRLRRALRQLGEGRHVANGNGEGRRQDGAWRQRARRDRSTRSAPSQVWSSRSSGPDLHSATATPTAPRNRSYVIMNNVLYHLHPVKVKRHSVCAFPTPCAWEG